MYHVHNHTVYTVSQSCVWRHTIGECIQKESKLLMCALLGKSKHLKHLFLNVILMNTDRTTTKFGTV